MYFVFFLSPLRSLHQLETPVCVFEWHWTLKSRFLALVLSHWWIHSGGRKKFELV